MTLRLTRVRHESSCVYGWWTKSRLHHTRPEASLYLQNLQQNLLSRTFQSLFVHPAHVHVDVDDYWCHQVHLHPRQILRLVKDYPSLTQLSALLFDDLFKNCGTDLLTTLTSVAISLPCLRTLASSGASLSRFTSIVA